MEANRQVHPIMREVLNQFAKAPQPTCFEGHPYPRTDLWDRYDEAIEDDGEREPDDDERARETVSLW